MSNPEKLLSMCLKQGKMENHIKQQNVHKKLEKLTFSLKIFNYFSFGRLIFTNIPYVKF